MKKIIYLFILLFSLVSCANNPNYKKSHNIKKRSKHVKKVQKINQRKLNKVRNGNSIKLLF